MATLLSRPAWGRIINQGIFAGIIGGILIDAFFYFSMLAMTHQASIVGIWQFVASSVVGATAYTSTNYAWLGLLLHALVSIGWAIGYAYSAATRASVLERPWVSGFAYGIVVWLFMQFILMAAHIFPGITIMSFIMGIIAHTFFYGIPVALTVRSLTPRTA